jgi:hypothetical protein
MYYEYNFHLCSLPLYSLKKYPTAASTFLFSYYSMEKRKLESHVCKENMTSQLSSQQIRQQRTEGSWGIKNSRSLKNTIVIQCQAEAAGVRKEGWLVVVDLCCGSMKGFEHFLSRKVIRLSQHSFIILARVESEAGSRNLLGNKGVQIVHLVQIQKVVKVQLLLWS